MKHDPKAPWTDACVCIHGRTKQITENQDPIFLYSSSENRPWILVTLM